MDEYGTYGSRSNLSARMIMTERDKAGVLRIKRTYIVRIEEPEPASLLLNTGILQSTCANGIIAGALSQNGQNLVG